MTTYPDSVRYLYSLGNEIRTIKLGLDRVRTLLGALGDPHQSFRSVHIAGTNGKGSTAAMISSALQQAGGRTGLYTSPHLIEPTERIQVNGAPVSPEQFSGAFDEVHNVAERLHHRGELEAHPTYFETVTAMAFLLFRQLGVETAVLETGLGGRLDATNVVQPELCVITRVDYDHEAWLGNSIEAIAGEKAGILKPGAPAVFAPQRPEARRVLEDRAGELGIRFTDVSEWRAEELLLECFGSSFLACRGEEQFPVECPLGGSHQVENTLTAVAALRELDLDCSAIQRGVVAARWPGRLERMRAQPEIVLDGAHNPNGIRALAGHIRRFYRGRKVWVIFGSMRDKSLDEMAGVLAGAADRVILTRIDSHRALRTEVLERLFHDTPVQTARDIDQALDMAAHAAAEDAVFITGSLLLVGEARRRLLAGS